jgi:hypothetical protein
VRQGVACLRASGLKLKGSFRLWPAGPLSLAAPELPFFLNVFPLLFFQRFFSEKNTHCVTSMQVRNAGPCLTEKILMVGATSSITLSIYDVLKSGVAI